MKTHSARWITTTALFTAMNVILSMSVFSIPVPGGHLYFCDAVINTAAILMDPLAAAIVGGLGSFLGDFFFYPAPMFVSLVTHGLQALVTALLARHLRIAKLSARSALAMAAGAVIMVAGYTLGRAYVYATPEISMIKLPMECVQAAFGAAASWTLLYPMRLEETYRRMAR